MLIGMPGLESAWPATHSCTPGSASFTNSARWRRGMAFVVARHWPGLDLDAVNDDFTAREALATIAGSRREAATHPAADGPGAAHP